MYPPEPYNNDNDNDNDDENDVDDRRQNVPNEVTLVGIMID